MMFQHELQPPPAHDATDASSSNSHGANLAPSTPQGSAGGLSRANSLARTRAVATLRRAASARELKRAASQNRHDPATASPSPVPPAQNGDDEAHQHVEMLADGPLDGAAAATAAAANGLAAPGGSLPVPVPGPHYPETGASDGGHSPNAAMLSALTAAFAASIPAPLAPAPSSDVAAAVSILAAAAAARNGYTISPAGSSSNGALSPNHLQPHHQPMLPASLSITPPIARTPPHLTTPGPTMASQVARTYAMAKLLGAAGLQMEAEEEPAPTAHEQPMLSASPVPPVIPEPQPHSELEAEPQRELEPGPESVPGPEPGPAPSSRLPDDDDDPSEAEEAPSVPPKHRESRLDDQLEEYAPSEDEADEDAEVVLKPPEPDAAAMTRDRISLLPNEEDHAPADLSANDEYEEKLVEDSAPLDYGPDGQEIIFAPLPVDVPVDAEDSPYPRQYSGAFDAVPTQTSQGDESTQTFYYPQGQEASLSMVYPPASMGEASNTGSWAVPDERSAAAPSLVLPQTTPAGPAEEMPPPLIPSPGEDSVSATLQPEADEPLTSVNSLDSPGLLLSATVNQINGPSEFEEKFLLLFSDTLVLAKPLAPPEGMEGEPRLRAESFMEKPDLDWSFSVERVVHLHRVGLIVHRDRAPMSKSHALMPSFVRHFSSNPEGAIDQLISLTGLNKDSRTIAKLLYQTPDLDPLQLCEFICSPQRQEVLDAYISLHAVTGVSIESGLRSFLLGIRFPSDRQSFKSLLISFSKHWVSSNRSLIKPAFSAGLAANLIFYIMALNDALHATETSRQMFSAPRPNYTQTDFLQEFRKLDAFGVLSDRTLGRIFASVEAEPIQEALPPRAGPLVIDRPDPDFAVRVYGKDMIFEPPVLGFAKSNRCSFTITPRSLDAKSITFVKIGRRAPHYVASPPDSSAETALPKSFNVTIEPRELRHTFTLTIAQGDAVKHKVTLSAESAHRKRVITNALKERIDICISKKRAQSREQAAKQAAAAAAWGGSGGAQDDASLLSPNSRRREPSPIPPLNSSGAETFSFCEPAAGSFLRRVYNHCTAFTSPSPLPLASPLLTPGSSHEGLKPHVTLTFAQSLDAKIAGVGGKQLILSGQESMLMTHSLRTLHDGILVGVGTAVNDNPQLNARQLPIPPPVERLPRPIVLDTQLRTPPNCKLLVNYQNGIGRQPLFVCARTASGIRAAELERAGAELVVASCEFDGLLSWRVVLAALARKGITRLMVEGGATVISGLLDSPFVDTLIVTVAPKLIGPQGISHNATLPLAGPSATGERGASEAFNLVTSRQFGRDVVFAWRRKEGSVRNTQVDDVSVVSSNDHLSVGGGSGFSHSHGHGHHAAGNSIGTYAHVGPQTTLGVPETSSAPVPTVSTYVPSPAPIPVPAPAPMPSAPASAPPTSNSGGFLGRLASLRRGNSTAKRNAPAATNANGGKAKSGHEAKGSRSDPPFHLF
ncbi:hypothetical protein OC844_003753 [Tilletia horrida]|nr:hypothetical protein OC844_003753 [Tilletia horrida]